MFKNMKCLFDTKFNSILWCFGEEAAIPVNLETHGIPFRTHEGIPERWDLAELRLTAPALVVIEDLIEKAYESESILELFTKKIHHLNITCIFTTQNFFYQSKFSRSISLNSNYVILTRNIRDKTWFHHLARQLEPKYFKSLVKVYDEALSEKYSHFLIDLHPDSNDALRYRTCMFSDEPCVFWIPPDKIDSLKNEKAVVWT